MKKIFTLIAAITFTGVAVGQTILLANTYSLVTHPGQGAAGKDVSATQTSLGATLYGSGQNRNTGYWMASKIVVPASGWYIDSLITYGYQTGSGTVSTMTGLYCYISADSSSRPSSTVVIGSKSVNALLTSNWTNIYRTPNDAGPFVETDRPIMKTKSNLTGTIPPGTHWVVWSATGSLGSGPWNPPSTVLGSLATGTNSYQYVPTGTLVGWNGTKDGTSQIEMPFKLWGKISTPTGLKEEVLVSSVSIAPNPVFNSATVKIELEKTAGINVSDLSFMVYDQLGREVMNYSNISSSTFNIEKGNLAVGNYFYKVINKNDQASLKTGKIIFQ
ncbi:MAG: T9SS type A sorting domain-containing protein [Bacteroidota bacterium]|nr:T9SS type A sorting domain-containing protein [Bacteroidota bacterium]MDP3147034.1 T9SS type A sorting domain-containing protein [Bacteroidota bacterium]